jgi:hypothetical protein
MASAEKLGAFDHIPQGPAQDLDDDTDSGVTPEMMKAGVRALKQAKGKSPAAIVAVVYQAMDSIEDQGNKPPNKQQGDFEKGFSEGVGPADNMRGASGPA